MKVLTIRQPWAGLIARGIKDVENRTWVPTTGLAIGDRFAVHAGRWDDHDRTDTLADDLDVGHPTCTARGFVICTVELVDVVRDADSPWAVEGHWHWVLDRPRLLRNAPQLPGRVGLWNLPLDDVR